MKKLALSLLTASLAVAGFATTASAGIIYNNGGPNQQNGNEMTEWIQAEDFTFTSAQTIGSMEFWSIEGIGDSTYNGSFDWAIYTDNAGTPGTILFSGDSVPTKRVNTGVIVLGAFTEWDNVFSLGNVSLGAGTYFIGIHNGPLTDTTRDEFYWETTNPNNTETGEEWDLQVNAGWDNNGQEHAFILYGPGTSTPEPASLLLCGLGVLSVAATRKFRKK